MKLWAKTKDFCEGKFLVVRRDGTAPHWPHFVLGARDRAAPQTLREYARIARSLGYEEAYCASIEELADDFDHYRKAHGRGDPEAPPHREDNPNVIAAMRGNIAIINVVPDKQNDLKPGNRDE